MGSIDTLTLANHVLLMDNPFNALLADDLPQSTILPLFGGADKPIEEMNEEERNHAAMQVYQKVREAAFSRGLPVIIKRNGQVVKEFADGHFESVI